MGFIEAPTNKTNPSLVIPTLNNPKTKPTYHKFVGSSMNRESGIIRNVLMREVSRVINQNTRTITIIYTKFSLGYYSLPPRIVIFSLIE